MLNRIITATIPADNFSMDLLVNRIQNQVREHFLEKMDNDENKVDEALKAPALFGISSPFALKEYIKNIYDAGGTNIDIYAQINQDMSALCIVKDNGNGFPDKFLGREAGESMVNYYDKKLKKNTIDEPGSESSRIVSSKTNDEAQKGGQGLGLATVARVLKKTNGTLQIGNVSDLPLTIQSAMNFDNEDKQVGAIIMMSSPPYSDSMRAQFQDEGSLTYLYQRYIDTIEREKDARNLQHLTIENDDSVIEAIQPQATNDSSIRKPLTLNLAEDDDLEFNSLQISPNNKSLGSLLERETIEPSLINLNRENRHIPSLQLEPEIEQSEITIMTPRNS